MQRMEPASNIVSRLGGPSVVARITGVHRTRVSNWMRPKEKGGTGGRIPQDHHRALLEYAREHDLSLSAEEFSPGERVA
jgi:hypothetical protein